MKKMKSSLMLLIAALCISACGSNKNNRDSSDEDFDEDSALAEEEVEEEEAVQPVGDRALYQVHGNVRSITFVEGCEAFKRSFTPFDGEDYSAQVKQKVEKFIRLTTISDRVSFDETGKSFSGNSEFFTSEQNDDGGTSCNSIFFGSDPAYSGDYSLASNYGCSYTYDASGKLIGVSGIDGGESYEYDQHDRLVRKSGGGEGGYGYEELFSYDEDGNVIKEEMIETEFNFDTSEHEVTNASSVTYTILEKDSKGNWTKRKTPTGDIDERKISYY